jgi:hypothetical protein
MSKQPQKAYWSLHPGEYQRHCVEREVLRFMGWNALGNLIRVAEGLPTSFDDTLLFADGIAVSFATASRISEWLLLKPENFVEYDTYFEVIDMEVHKRYRKVDHTVQCQRCKTFNDKFEVACLKCGANLLHAGKRKWKTVPVKLCRIPFMIPKKELTTQYLMRRLAFARQFHYPYLFYNPNAKSPVTRQCIYDHIVLAGKKIGLEMWPHRERAERCKQLREEYEFSQEDLKRFTMIVSSKTLEIYAGTSVPYQKKMGIT